jgi:High-affinity nickel-transport protein
VFGFDDQLVHFSDGRTLLLVLAIAALLGLRHATDPDHLAAVTSLVANEGRSRARRAAVLGFTWGAGHATALLVLGLPIVLYRAYLPESVERGAEVAVGFTIVALALSLLVRRHRATVHGHVHVRTRTRARAYAIGLLHGTGGSAGVGVLVLAGIPGHELAVLALAVFAVGTAVSMTLLSAGVGLTLGTAIASRSFTRVAPALALMSLAFGVWYTLGALALAPYPL